jgi:hypothetical protein
MKIVIHLVEDEGLVINEAVSPHPMYPIIQSSAPLPFDAAAFQFTSGKMRLGLDMIDVVNELYNQAQINTLAGDKQQPEEFPPFVPDPSKWLKVGESHLVMLDDGAGNSVGGPGGLCFYDVESSNVEAGAIAVNNEDADDSTIYVRFKESLSKKLRDEGHKPAYGAGPIYRYHNCAPEQFQAFLEAESKGKWMGQVLIDNASHPCEVWNKTTGRWDAVAIRPKKGAGHEGTNESTGR